MVDSWVKAQLMAFSRIDAQPPRSIRWIGTKLTILGIGRISHKLGLLSRYLYVNSLSIEGTEDDPKSSSAIEILFVAAEKDFRTLGLAINGVLESCNQEISKINIVVPEQDLAHCAEIVAPFDSTLIQITSESSLLDDSLIKLIFSRFGTRGGWVLQQILKLEFVRKSESDGVLIVDADTVLIKKRNWLNYDGIQVLMPSWEYHKPYFKFLADLPAFESESSFPLNHSFVAHHMLMQPLIVQEIYQACGWKSVEDLVDYLCIFSTSEGESPFSIDYELYGNYLILNHPEKVVLAKWGNTSSRYSDKLSIDLLKTKYSSFASVSLHSYLN